MSRPLSRPPWRRLGWTLALLALAGCASLLTRLGLRRDEIRFEHARHTRAKVECIACHEAIYDATTLAVNALPPEKKCLECHKEAKEKGNCGMCHAVPDAPGTYARRNRGELKLNHVRHLELTEENCATCHLNLAEGKPLLTATAPMATCTNCHPHQEELTSAKCGTCHTDLQRFALRPITTYSHQGDYVRRHVQDARAQGAACATCHEQSFCAECHAKTVPALPVVFNAERVDRPFIHGRDYLTRHSADAQGAAPVCAQCHGTSFCESCHSQQRLTPGGAMAFNPHPRDFNTSGSPNFHGLAARRNIESCAACHDQGAQSNCVECHRVGGIGGNPHPPSWLLRHGREEINRNAMCLACHP